MIHDGTGGWRASKHNEGVFLPHHQYEIIKSDSFKIPTFECKESKVNDEYDTDDTIDEHIISKEVETIRGEVPGTGKSYMCQRMAERDYKVIFICPTSC